MCSDGINRKKKWEQKRSQTDAWQQFFTETKNVWNDLDMIMQLRVKHCATQGNLKVSRGTWDRVNFEMQGAVKIASNVLGCAEVLMLNQLLLLHGSDHHYFSFSESLGEFIWVICSIFAFFYLLVYRLLLNSLHEHFLSL